MTYRTAALGCGALFVVLAFICLLVGLCTNSWVIIQVNRAELGIGTGSPATLAAFTRSRGLFKECYEDRAATRSYVVNSPFADELNECLTTDFIIDRRVNVTYTAHYRTRADLMIAMVIFLCFALLLCVCGFGVFGYGVSIDEEDMPKKWKLATKWAGILIFMAAFCNALGMAFFHGAEYMETQIIETNGADAPYKLFFKRAQPSALQNATTRTYSWSYAMAWLAVFFEVISAICLFMCGACCAPKSRRSEKEYIDVNTLNSSRSYGQRNLAYEYMESKGPVLYEAQPPQMISDGGVYHDHFRGRHYDPYSRGTAGPQSGARAQYNYDAGGWNWQ